MTSQFNFNLKKAAIYQAVLLEKLPIFGRTRTLKNFFFSAFFILFSVFLFGFLSTSFSISYLSLLLGLIIISGASGLTFWLFEMFFESKIKNPHPSYLNPADQINVSKIFEDALAHSEKYNLAEFLSFEAAKAAGQAIKTARSKKFYETDSLLLLYFLLKDNPKLNFIFSRLLLSVKDVQGVVLEKLAYLKQSEFSGNFSQTFQNSVLEAIKTASQKNHKAIEIGDIITALARHDLVFKKILVAANLKSEDIESLAIWLESLEKMIEEREKWWDYKNLARQGSLGKEWATGYTVTLDRFSIDLSQEARRLRFPECVGHQREIEQIERILSRREINNVLAVGEPGSGRKSIILEIAKRSILGEGLAEVNYKRVLKLNLPSLISQVDPEQAETTLDIIFKEAISAGNVILVIDEFHNFVGHNTGAGFLNIAGIIAPYLQLPQFQLIALTTFAGLHRQIEQNPSLLALFEKVEVSEISEKETLKILENLTFIAEQKYKIFIHFQALRDVISFSSKYLQDSPLPEKAIELFDTVTAYVAQTEDKVMQREDVVKIMRDITEIPVGELEEKEKATLLNLENLIHQRIINQEEAVSEISSALRRARAEVTVRKGPMGTFLFLGPTGVGKTETSKALAQIYFGSEERMIRLDMSEFQNVTDIPRLIGSPGEEGLLTTQIRENPFSLILLDELEKAHPNILNLFLQVLDEGHVTDGLGRKIDFKNSIIIATSNAGYQIILEALKQGKSMPAVKNDLLDFIFKERIFRPEFINRFDGVVVFRSLSKENLLDIAELLLQQLKKNLQQKEIEFIITQALKEKIVELGYDPIFGARQMRRVIQDKVENILASAILADRIKKEDKVEINQENFTLIINR